MKTIILLSFLAVLIAAAYGWPEFDEDELEIEIQRRLIGKLGRKIGTAIKKKVIFTRKYIDKILGQGKFDSIINSVAGKLSSSASKSICSTIASTVVRAISHGILTGGSIADKVCEKAMNMVSKGVSKIGAMH